MGGDGTFGVLLRGCRRDAGLSQAELAERSGLTVRTISNLEAGRIKWPHPNSVQRLADALGLSGDRHQQFVASASRRLGHPVTASPAGLDDEHVVPRQLPASVPHFVGRAAELGKLNDLAGAGPPPAATIGSIVGSAGVGKTALAVHWAHAAADRFPDGQLYIDLHGWGPSAEPVTPADAVGRFLDALGLPAAQIPPGDDARHDLYRSVTAARRMLIVLDNARDAAQVRPLLPGGSSCLVLVTSRSELAGLVAMEAACPVSLDVLTAAEGRALLAFRLGQDRVAAEPAPVGELVELCARLPLALAIAAARAALRPGMSLAALAAELRDAASRLAVLEAGDGVSLAAVFSWSYDQLPEPASTMFRLLGVHPGPDISTAAAASLAGTSRDRARETLGLLAGASLLAEHVPGRFRFHDLLRGYAAGRAGAEDSESCQRDAIRRTLDHFLHSARAADEMRQVPPAAAPAPPQPGVTPERFRDYQQFMAWLHDEQQVLTALLDQATNAGFDAYGWQLAMTLSAFYDRKGHSASSLAFQHAALAATQRLGDDAAQALLQLRIGNTCIRLGSHHEAVHHLHEALLLYERLGDGIGRVRAHLGLGAACAQQDQYRDSLTHGAAALTLSQSLAERTFQAVALNNLGWGHAQLGNYQQAIGYCRQAIGIHHELGEHEGEAHAWDSLSYTYHHLGQHAQAVTGYERAVALFRAIGDRFYEAIGLDHLGDAHHANGKPALAAQAWRQAATIFAELHHDHAQDVRDKLQRAESDHAKAAGHISGHISDEYSLRGSAGRRNIGDGVNGKAL